MTPEKTKEALANLAQVCKDHGASVMKRLDGTCPCRCDLTTVFGSGRPMTTHQLDHLFFMAIEAQKFVDAGRIEKAMRWLGFIQGAVWGGGLVSIDSMKDLNRPDESK